MIRKTNLIHQFKRVSKSLSISFRKDSSISTGGFLKICKLAFHESLSFAKESATEFFPLGIYWIHHCPSLWMIRWIRLRMVVPLLSPFFSVRRWSTSRLSAWIVTWSKPFFRHSKTPSKIPYNSTSKGLHFTNEWVNPRNHELSPIWITPPVTDCPIFLATAPSVNRWVHSVSSCQSTFSVKGTVVESFKLTWNWRVQLTEVLIISKVVHVLFWNMKRFMFFHILQKIISKRLAQGTPLSCTNTEELISVRSQSRKGSEKICVVNY